MGYLLVDLVSVDLLIYLKVLRASVSASLGTKKAFHFTNYGLLATM